jgi:predicted NodU family carbamoyl transferase
MTRPLTATIHHAALRSNFEVARHRAPHAKIMAIVKANAVLHLDKTARLQTVCCNDDPVLEEILREYFALSGVPVLCNTSANHNGRGFFPDVASAMDWGHIDLIWSQGTLYRKVPA